MKVVLKEKILLARIGLCDLDCPDDRFIEMFQSKYQNDTSSLYRDIMEFLNDYISISSFYDWVRFCDCKTRREVVSMGYGYDDCWTVDIAKKRREMKK